MKSQNKTINASKSQTTISDEKRVARTFAGLMTQGKKNKQKKQGLDMFQSPLMNKLANSSVQLLDLPPEDRYATLNASRKSSSKSI